LIYTVVFTGTELPAPSYCLLLAVITLLPSYAKDTGKENKVTCFLLKVYGVEKIHSYPEHTLYPQPANSCYSKKVVDGSKRERSVCAWTFSNLSSDGRGCKHFIYCPNSFTM